MEQENQEVTEAQETSKTYTEAEVQEMIAGLEAKKNELLSEAKTAKQRARELEEAQEQAKLERQKEKGEFKELYEKEQKSKLELQEQFEGLRKSIQEKEISLATNSIAAELTKDTKRAALLAKEVSQYAKYTDDGVSFELGGVQVEREKVVSHISESYPFLVDGSGATGGDSRGGAAKGSAEKTVTRSQFDNMNQSQRADFAKSGGKVVND